MKVSAAGVYRSIGQTLWRRRRWFCVGLAKCSDGGYILAGSTDNIQNETYDFYLVKTDEFGVEEWSTQIDYGESGLATGIVETPNGYAVCRRRIAQVEDEKIDSDVLPGFTERMCLVRTDGNGNPKWMKEYGELHAGMDLVRTSDGGYIIAGASEGWSADPLGRRQRFRGQDRCGRSCCLVIRCAKPCRDVLAFVG